MSLTPEQPQVTPAAAKKLYVPHIAVCFLLGPLLFLLPKMTGRWIQRVPLWKGVVVGLFYLALTVPFLQIFGRMQLVYSLFRGYGHPLPWLLAVLVVLLGMIWLVVLPFVPRPGSNRAALIHLTRGLFFSAAFYPIAGLLLYAVVVCIQKADWILFFDEIIGLWSCICSVLLMFWVIQLARAVSLEYRSAHDYPPPREPLCEVCGYDLHTADPQGRCPECGRPVSESLDPESRQPSAWELDPSWYKPRQVFRQLKTLLTHPLKMFASIPLTTHQQAARRWLVLSIFFTGSLAALLVIGFLYISAVYSADVTGVNWLFVLGAGVSIGVVWAFLGMLMVGIETGGLAIISHFRKNPVDLANASKVTSYASTCLPVWVITGLTQLAGFYVWTGHPSYKHASEFVKDSVAFGTLAVFHIAGLLVFEWMVYAGLRKIQYANR